MNALRHGLAAKIAATADNHAVDEDWSVDAMYERLRQIEVERVKAINRVHHLSRSEDLDGLHSAVQRLAALERYSKRSHSKLRKDIV
jgi:hypothetical protein